jgi:hypothetical protein
MQDFTKPFKLKNEVKQLELNIPNQPKIGFISSRMNKDNFWNLVYFVGMFIGFASAVLIDKQPISGIIGVVTLFGMPYLVKRNADITFDKMEQGAPMFIINGNKRVNATGIGFVALLVVSLPITAVLTGAKSKLAILFVFWFIPTLYCILRNLPIAVYFKKEAWVGDGTVSCSSKSRDRHQFSTTKTHSRKESIVTSPRYRYLSCNIYNRR